MNYLIVLAICLLMFVSAPFSYATDPGWPREQIQNGNRLLIYQPQIDSWTDYRNLDFRMAVTMTPASGAEVVGVLEMHGQTVVDYDSRLVMLSGLKIKRTRFPSLDEASASKMEQLAKTFIPQTITISLDRLAASVPKKNENLKGVELRNDPPAIFVTYQPAILLDIDGEPVRAAIARTGLEYVINTRWPLFFDKTSSVYYLLAGEQWLQATDLQGPWSGAIKLPGDMKKLAKIDQWKYLKKYIPPAAKTDKVIPRVFYSTAPAEIIYIDGKPSYTSVPETQLQYVSNTTSYIFFHTPTGQYYYLTSGRWFRASSLAGPWMFATPDLPPDFRLIPPSSPAAQVLSSVPGTEEAKDAVLLAQIPTTVVVNPDTAPKEVKVIYAGTPKFVLIDGTTLYYGVNTSQKVIKVGDIYYLCFQGIWFLSSRPDGPWQTARSVPQVIYTIPVTSPVYNVTYVTQTVTPQGYVQASYTSGYMGVYLMGVSTALVLTSGTGYYYHPYITPYPVYGYPAYYPHPYTYGYSAHYYTAAGGYGVSQVAYGNYGVASRSATYNPYTGNYTRTASVSNVYGTTTASKTYNAYTGTYARGTTTTNAYGTARVGQAYNPYTGGYAATSQGSNAYGSWGNSVVSKGGQTAYTQHETNYKGTKGSVQTSSGSSANVVRSASGNTSAAKTGSGDLYAGHDGNVYKKSGSGWQQYNNGGWSSVQQPSAVTQKQPVQQATAAPSQNLQGSQRTAPATGQQHTTQGFQGGSAQMQSLQQEYQNRERGTQSTQRTQEMQKSWSERSSSGGGFAGRSFGGGGRGRR